MATHPSHPTAITYLLSHHVKAADLQAAVKCDISADEDEDWGSIWEDDGIPEADEIAEMIASKTRSDGEEFTYTILGQKVRMERKTGYSDETEFILSDYGTGIMLRYYFDHNDGLAKVDTFVIKREHEDWRFTYASTEHRGKRKRILGYDCYLVGITERCVNKKEGWDDTTRFECYVTDQLPLPGHEPAGMRLPYLKTCALEITRRNPRLPLSYTLILGTHVNTEANPDLLEVPERFKHLAM